MTPSAMPAASVRWAPERERDHRGDHAGGKRIDGEQQREVDPERHQARRQPGLVGLGVGIPATDDPLQRVVERLGQPGQLDPDVGDQPGALRRDRRPQFGRPGDPLDQHLDLAAFQHLAPHLLGGLGLQDLLDDLRKLLAAEPRRLGVAGHRPLDRPADRRAAQRPQNRLFDGLIEGAVDARRMCHPPGAPRAGGQQAGHRGFATFLLHGGVIIAPGSAAPAGG